MVRGEAFDLRGTYRVQSKARRKHSRLAGTWGAREAGELDDTTVNRHLTSHPFWNGGNTVRLRPAFVTKRAGEFADEPDILYKQSHFVPNRGCAGMPANIVDVVKAAAKWRHRRPFLAALLSDVLYAQAEHLVDDVQGVAANEYFVHEAGHCLGYDTARKYAQGYFRVGGKIAWPLVYVEEFRADVLSFGFAADLLDETSAASVFLYNVLLRLGVHLEGNANDGSDPYGPIPMMLYSLLRRLGWFEPDGTHAAGIRVTSLVPADLVGLMRACAAAGCNNLVKPELQTNTATDAALVAARYYRGFLDDHEAAAEFASICDAAVARVGVSERSIEPHCAG